MSEKVLFLLDGHALVYRAHYAFITRPLINSKGQNTSAISGFVRVLWDLIRNQKPSHLAVSFDMHGPTFRHELFEPYKANREAQPEDITFAIPEIKRILKAWNIPIIEKQGFEADDLIGTLAKKAEKEGFKVYMVTPDKDYAQLVSENIFIYKPSRSGTGVEIQGVPEILEKWDIERVDQVIDVLGLQGDAVDNIPGIPGIGAKTAVKFLKQFDSLEGLIANTDKLKGKMKEKVIEFAEQGILSKQLATINIDSPADFDATYFEIDKPNVKALSEIFNELEFRTLANSILSAASTTPQPVQGTLFGDPAPTKEVKAIKLPDIAKKNIENVPHSYHLITTLSDLEKLVGDLAKLDAFCFDTETTSVNANDCELVGISFCYKAFEAYYVHMPTEKEEMDAFLAILKPLFENEKTTKIGQNLKYDALVLKWYTIEVNGYYFDTMLAHYLLEPELRHNMNYLAETYLGYKPIPIEQILGKAGKKQLKMSDIPETKIVDYAAEDADITWQLYEYFKPKLTDEKLLDLYNSVEEPMIKALVEMEFNGVRIDADRLAEYSKVLGEELKEIEQTIYKEAGSTFNIQSPKQIGEILFERLKIPYRWKKTKSGQFSTNEEKLTELSTEYPFVAKILEFRQLRKLQNTYLDALPKLVNAKSGRIHSSFNQAATSTGRLSSTEPNLQNIPVRSVQGAEVRKAFIPKDEDHLIMAVDYSQIELRLIAEMSDEKAMLEAFEAGLDIHTSTAAKVFDVAVEEVTKQQRYQAKTVNFSIIYGAGATNLSKQLEIPRKEAKEIIDQYYTQYNGLKTFMDKIVADARENGYVETLLGRKRHLRDINSKNGMMRSQAERNAINSPVQGTAADLIKLAMSSIHVEFKAKGFKSKLIMQVHDELVFDVLKDELEEVKALVVEKMKNAIPDLGVPIVVEAGIGNNWLEAH